MKRSTSYKGFGIPPAPKRHKLKPMSRAELFAFERFTEGKASGDDFIHVARIFKRCGALAPDLIVAPDRDVARMLQAIDYRFSEGIDRIVMPGGDT